MSGIIKDCLSGLTYLLETDLAGSLAEALSANIQGVLSDDGVSVAANTAKKGRIWRD